MPKEISSAPEGSKLARVEAIIRDATSDLIGKPVTPEVMVLFVKFANRALEENLTPAEFEQVELKEKDPGTGLLAVNVPPSWLEAADRADDL